MLPFCPKDDHPLAEFLHLSYLRLFLLHLELSSLFLLLLLEYRFSRECRFGNRLILRPDGRFVLLCYGRSGHKDMPVNRSFSGIFTLDGGPESDITMSAGDKWTVKWERGLILKGKLL